MHLGHLKNIYLNENNYELQKIDCMTKVITNEIISQYEKKVKKN